MKIVMYHYVRMPDSRLPFFNFLHKDHFARQLDVFERESAILHPNVLNKAIETGKPTPGYLLSFDDGLKDHYRFVFPELKSRGLSGLFYINSSWYRTGKMLNVHKTHLLLGKEGGTKLLQMLEQIIQPAMIPADRIKNFEDQLYPYQLNDEDSLAVKKLLNFYVAEAFQTDVIDQLMMACGLSEKEEGEQYYASISELQQMAAAGMVIGSHTDSHPVLSKLNRLQQQQEILTADEFLMHHHCLSLPKSFCYPYGYLGTFNQHTGELLQQHGYHYALMVDPRAVTENDLLHHKMALPRFDCNMFEYGSIYKPNQIVQNG